MFLLLRFSLFFGFLLCAFWVGAKQNLLPVLKVQVYTYDAQRDHYRMTHFGSAVALSRHRFITNAHVIMQSDRDEPAEYYEMCGVQDYAEYPTCFWPARLLSYDPILDLALLETILPLPIQPLSLSSRRLDLGEGMVIYGYPKIGGETITRTEGKLAGSVQWVYKLDGSIDHGSSGGAALSSSGELVGIPFAVSADNGVIGYVIPVSSLKRFIAKKSEWYTEVVIPSSDSFLRFLSGSSLGKEALQDERVLFPRPSRYGLELRSHITHPTLSAESWTFTDRYERLNLFFSCSDDAGNVLGRDLQKLSIARWDMLDSSRIIESFVWSGAWYRVQYIPRDPERSSQKSNLVLMYARDFDACSAELYFSDPVVDRKILKRAEEFISSIRFRRPYVLPSSHRSPLFSYTGLTFSGRTSWYLDALGDLRSEIDIVSTSGRLLSTKKIEHTTYHSLDELFTLPFQSESYTGSYDREAFTREFQRQFPTATVLTQVRPNGVTSYFTTERVGRQVTVNFFVPLRRDDQILSWSWTDVLWDPTDQDISDITSFFRDMTLPGISPF